MTGRQKAIQSNTPHHGNHIFRAALMSFLKSVLRDMLASPRARAPRTGRNHRAPAGRAGMSLDLRGIALEGDPLAAAVPLAL